MNAAYWGWCENAEGWGVAEVREVTTRVYEPEPKCESDGHENNTIASCVRLKEWVWSRDTYVQNMCAQTY
jgi:hypothetical protein